MVYRSGAATIDALTHARSRYRGPTPTVLPATTPDVVHRPHGLLDGRVRVGTVAEHEVEVVEAKALAGRRFLPPRS